MEEANPAKAADIQVEINGLQERIKVIDGYIGEKETPSNSKTTDTTESQKAGKDDTALSSDNVSEQFSYNKDGIDNLIKVAKAKSNKLVKQVISPVSPELVEDLRKGGINVDENYVHTIDNFSIAHSLKQHGNEKNEDARGQIALVDADFGMIPDIIDNYDGIEFDKNKRGQDIIKYFKTFEDGTTYYVEEVRVGRKELSMLTLYKRKLTGEPMPEISSEVLTSEAAPDLLSEDKGSEKNSVEQEIEQLKALQVQMMSDVAHLDKNLPAYESARQTGLDAIADVARDIKLLEQQSGSKNSTNAQVKGEKKSAKAKKEKKAKTVYDYTPEEKGRIIGEPQTREEAVALWIMKGGKIRWSDRVSGTGAVKSRGFGSHLGLSRSEKERRGYVNIIANDGLTPEEFAEAIYMEDETAWGGLFRNMDTGEILDIVLDVLFRVHSTREAFAYIYDARPARAEAEENYVKGLIEAREQRAQEQELEIIEKGYNEVIEFINNDMPITLQELDEINTYYINQHEENLLNFVEIYEYDQRREDVGLGEESDEAGLDRVTVGSDASDAVLGGLGRQQHESIDGGDAGRAQGHDQIHQEVRTDGNTVSATGRDNEGVARDAGIAEESLQDDNGRLTSAQEQALNRVIADYDADIEAAMRQLSEAQKEYQATKRAIGKRQASETQVSLFAEDKSGQDLFGGEVKSDFGDANLMRIFGEQKEKVSAALVRLNALRSGREKFISDSRAGIVAQGEISAAAEMEKAEAEYKSNQPKIADTKPAAGDFLPSADYVKYNSDDHDYKSYEEQVAAEKKLITKEALEKTANGKTWHERSVDFNDAVYDFDYFGFTIEHAPKGKYNLSMRFKYDRDGKWWNPYITYDYKNITIDKAVEMVNKEYDRISSLGTPRSQAEQAEELAAEKTGSDKYGIIKKRDIVSEAAEWVKSWRETYESLKQKNDLAGLKDFRIKLNIALNGMVQGRVANNPNKEEILQAFNDLRSEVAREAKARAEAELAEFERQKRKVDNDIARLNRQPLDKNGSQTSAGKMIVRRLEDSRRLLAKIEAKQREIEEIWKKARFQVGDLEAVNERFNAELETLTPENADKKIFNLGNPSAVVLSAGVPNKPYRLYGNKLIKKAKQHGYSISDIRDLPQALSNPIAIFDGGNGIINILTEIEINGKKTLVGVHINHENQIDFNFIATVFDKSQNSVINWINKGKGLYYDKEKTLAYLHFPEPISAASNNQELDSAAKVIKDFENPKLSDKKMKSLSTEEFGELVEWLKRTGLYRNVIVDEAQMREYIERYLGKEGAERFWMQVRRPKRGDRWQNSGYDEREDGTRASIRAVEAESEGTFTAGTFRKVYDVAKADFELLVDLGFIKQNEWHHTGKSFKKSDYYSWADSERSDGIIEYGDAANGWQGEDTENSLAQRYADNKKAIRKLAKEYAEKQWEYRQEQGKEYVPDFELFAKQSDAVRSIELTDEEHNAISKRHMFISEGMWKAGTDSYTRRRAHEKVDAEYAKILNDRKQQAIEANRAELERQYAEQYGEVIRQNEQTDKYNAEIDNYNRGTAGKEKVLERIAERLGISAEQSYRTIKYISRARQKAEAEARRQVKIDEKRREINAQVADMEAEFKEWENAQRAAGNISSYSRLSKEPEHSIRKYSEMNGKYGWFNSERRNYNLPEYHSGIQFASKELLDEYKSKQEEIYRVKIQEIKLMATSKGEVLGFVTVEGDVYLDPANMNANTPIHEFGHLWNTYIRKNNKPLWEKGKALAKQSALWGEVSGNSRAYGLKKNATEDDIADEVLARMYGERGAEVIEEKGLKEKLLAWVREVWAWIGNNLGIRNLTPEQIQHLTLEQFVNGAVADLLSGESMQKAEQTDYDFDVTGITEENAREMKQIKEAAVANGTFMKAPNGKQSNLNERQWLQVRTRAFKRWFGDWESAAIINLAERVWNGDMTSGRINFALSEKARNELKNLFGKDFEIGFLTDSDIRHTKNHHGQNEGKRGQIDITPEDLALVPFVMNEFDNVRHAETDSLGNRKVEFTKRINGTIYVASIERGKNKEQLITMWKTPSQVADAKSPSPTSETTPNGGTKVQQISETLRNSAKNVSKVVDENGEPQVVYHGTNEDFTEFDINTQGKYSYWGGVKDKGFFFANKKKDAEAHATDNRVIEAFLNLRNPLIENVDEFYRNRKYYTAQDWYDNLGNRERVIAAAEQSGSDGFIVSNGSLGTEMHNAFSPSQIKSATDNNGNFDSESGDIRYQLFELETDRQYKEAIQRGDIAAAERLLDKLARANGYEREGNFYFHKDMPEFDREAYQKEYFDRYEAGKELHDMIKEYGYRAKFMHDNTIILYHGSSPENIAGIRKNGSRNQLYLASSQSEVKKHVDAKRKNNEILEMRIDPRDVQLLSGSNEYFAPDGLIRGTDGVWQSPKRAGINGDVKLANVQSYNEDGELILPSERFNRDSDDIRFMFVGEQGAANLDKAEEATTRMDNLNVAREMEAAFAEKKKRIEKLRTSEPIEITGKEITPSEDLKEYKKNALEYGKTIQGKYTNKDTGQTIQLQRGRKNGGIKEVLQHDITDIEHLQSVAAIPQIIENSIYIDSLPNDNKENNPTIERYDYYVVGLKIGGVDYTVRASIAIDTNGDRYYDHKLTQIEKGKLIDLAGRVTNPAQNQSVSGYKDKRLILILQTNDKENAKKIKFATGWERGADGLWRYEVGDGIIKKTPLITYPYKLSDIYDDEELYAAYPALRDIDLYFTYDMPELGSYSKENGIQINAKLVLREKEVINGTGDEFYQAEINSVIIHEVQHAIQEIEGFARGGNLEIGEREAQVRDNLISAKEAYFRLAGEVEARNNEERMGMSAEERRATLAEETEDVAREDQIFIFEALGKNNLEMSEKDRGDNASGGVRFHVEKEGRPSYKDYSNLYDYMQALNAWMKQNAASDRTIVEMRKAKDFKSSYARVKAVLSDKNRSTANKVDAVTEFIKGYLSAGQLSSPSVKRLLTQIKNTAKSRTNELDNIFNQIFAEVINNQIRNSGAITEELLRMKLTRLNRKRQREGMKTDNETRVAVEALRANMRRSEEDIKRLISEENNIIEDAGASEGRKEEARAKLVGLTMANIYRTKVATAAEEIRRLEGEIKGEKDRKVKAAGKAYINRLKSDLAIEIAAFNRELNSFIESGKSRYAAVAARQEERKRDLLHKANSATKGIKGNIFEDKKGALVDAGDFIAASLQSLNHILKRISVHAVDGKSELYHYVSGTWHSATESEYEHIERRRKDLEAVTGRLFGYRNRTAILGLLRLSHKETGIRAVYGGEDINLTYGNALSIVLWGRQSAGSAALSKMGIDVEQIEELLKKTAVGRAFLSLGEWMTDAELPANWERHNAEYKKRHGTDLGKEDNYFPLKRLRSQIYRNADIASDTEEVKGVQGTAGATRERTRNLLALDIKADAVELFLNHINEMEHETAFGQFKEDMNILINSSTFMNNLDSLHSGLSKYFEKAARFAYSNRMRRGDEQAIVDILKNINAAKIAFKTDTALKQFVSGIAAFTEADSSRVISAIGKALVGGSYSWAMKNLPLFRKRVSEANAGNEKVRFRERDRKSLMRRGMWLNRKIDAFTSAITAKAVYEVQKERYLKMGYSAEGADRQISEQNKISEDEEATVLKPAAFNVI